jgi:hypothetical protein
MAAYALVDVEITDSAGFADYRKLVPASMAEFGGRFPGACLSIPREPRWLREGANTRRAAQVVVSATAKTRNTADAALPANPSGPGGFLLIRRCRLLIGS